MNIWAIIMCVCVFVCVLLWGSKTTIHVYCLGRQPVHPWNINPLAVGDVVIMKI